MHGTTMKNRSSLYTISFVINHQRHVSGTNHSSGQIQNHIGKIYVTMPAL